jgi:hypothetical protein
MAQDVGRPQGAVGMSRAEAQDTERAMALCWPHGPTEREPTHAALF